MRDAKFYRWAGGARQKAGGGAAAPRFPPAVRRQQRTRRRHLPSSAPAFSLEPPPRAGHPQTRSAKKLPGTHYIPAVWVPRASGEKGRGLCGQPLAWRRAGGRALGAAAAPERVLCKGCRGGLFRGAAARRAPSPAAAHRHRARRAAVWWVAGPCARRRVWEFNRGACGGVVCRAGCVFCGCVLSWQRTRACALSGARRGMRTQGDRARRGGGGECCCSGAGPVQRGWRRRAAARGRAPALHSQTGGQPHAPGC
jgi:hypothetical protein